MPPRCYTLQCFVLGLPRVPTVRARVRLLSSLHVPVVPRRLGNSTPHGFRTVERLFSELLGSFWENLAFMSKKKKKKERKRKITRPSFSDVLLRSQCNVKITFLFLCSSVLSTLYILIFPTINLKISNDFLFLNKQVEKVIVYQFKRVFFLCYWVLMIFFQFNYYCVFNFQLFVSQQSHTSNIMSTIMCFLWMLSNILLLVHRSIQHLRLQKTWNVNYYERHWFKPN